MVGTKTTERLVKPLEALFAPQDLAGSWVFCHQELFKARRLSLIARILGWGEILSDFLSSRLIFDYVVGNGLQPTPKGLCIVTSKLPNRLEGSQKSFLVEIVYVDQSLQMSPEQTVDQRLHALGVRGNEFSKRVAATVSRFIYELSNAPRWLHDPLQVYRDDAQ